MTLRMFLSVVLFCANLLSAGFLLAQEKVRAVSTDDFLGSMGACSSVSRRGEKLDETIESMKYTGLRWLRVGFEDNAPVEDFIRLHNETGTLFSYGLLSGKSDIERLIDEAKQLAQVGALLALEGANEPNNWTITYKGKNGGGQLSWVPVAELHRDLYRAVKTDPILKEYPVWATTETGAQTDNAGLQFLTIPNGAETLLPTGTQFADFANCHNYITHPAWQGLHNNQTWHSASPAKDCPVDGLYGNFGTTWLKKFPGYTEKELLDLPRVTTETGYALNLEEGITEDIQGRLYLNLYLSQFKRGWKYTAVYLLKGRANEPEHEKYAFFTLDNKPKKAAQYMHNFTTILADSGEMKTPGHLAYSIPDCPETTHDLLLQKNNGRFFLVLWGERFTGGTDNIEIHLARRHKIKIYNPIVGTSPVETLAKTDKIKLSLTNHPLIMEIL